MLLFELILRICVTFEDCCCFRISVFLHRNECLRSVIQIRRLKGYFIVLRLSHRVPKITCKNVSLSFRWLFLWFQITFVFSAIYNHDIQLNFVYLFLLFDCILFLFLLFDYLFFLFLLFDCSFLYLSRLFFNLLLLLN